MPSSFFSVFTFFFFNDTATTEIYTLSLHDALPISRYPDMDPLGNVAGMMRAVSEVRAVVRWAQPQANTVVVAGISMGTPVAALVSHLERRVDAVALYTPILGLNAMIARHLERWGSSRDGYREL